MVRLSRPICPSRACAKALPIVLVQIAAIRMAVTIPITNFVHSVGMTASIHELSIQPHPGRSRSRGAPQSHLPAAAEAAGSAIPKVFLAVRAGGGRNCCESGNGQGQRDDKFSHDRLLCCMLWAAGPMPSRLIVSATRKFGWT